MQDLTILSVCECADKNFLFSRLGLRDGSSVSQDISRSTDSYDRPAIRDRLDMKDRIMFDARDRLRNDARDRPVTVRDHHVTDARDRQTTDARNHHVTDSRNRHVHHARDRHVTDARDRQVPDARDRHVPDARDRHVTDARDRGVTDTRDRPIRSRRVVEHDDPSDRQIFRGDLRNRLDRKRKGGYDSNGGSVFQRLTVEVSSD